MDAENQITRYTFLLLIVINRFKSISKYFSEVRGNLFEQQGFNSIDTLYGVIHLVRSHDF